MTNQEYYDKLCKDSEKVEKLSLMVNDAMIDVIETIRDYYQIPGIEYVGLEPEEVRTLDWVVRILKEIQYG